jgi:hypothetical protein
VTKVGMDETSARKGQDYVNIFADMELGRVLFATEGRDAATVARFATDLAAHGGALRLVTGGCSAARWWVGHTGFVDAAPLSLYRGHRYPVGIISHCVWLYHRFPLSVREVEEMMMARGVLVTYETIHQWCRKFGQAFANGLRRGQPRPGDKWHLDEVFIKIRGKSHYLWRAVDQDGNVLDILVTSQRDAKAATRFSQAPHGIAVRAAGADH